MLADPNAPLSPPQFEVLLALSKGTPEKDVPAERCQQLAKLGFVSKSGTGYQLTSAGRLRLMRGG